MGKSAVKDAQVSDIKALMEKDRKQTNEYPKKSILDYDEFFEGNK